MPRKVRLGYIAHSLRSDWNNGNAHFLRGLLGEMAKAGHAVRVFEPARGWSLEHLLEEPAGASSLAKFTLLYPELDISCYSPEEEHDAAFWRNALDALDVVILHEWNSPDLANLLLGIRDQSNFKLLFHDTHHRATSSPEQIRNMGVDFCDGVIAFGEALKTIYREQFRINRVWTLHEAADTKVFRPLKQEMNCDVVWVGNWGDNERSQEICEFLLRPAASLPERRFIIRGVRYPAEALSALNDAGVEYGGYLPNLDAPEAYAAARLTVHIPRQQYVQAMNGIPTIRVFEALACGIPLISAPWQDTEGLFREGDLMFVRDEQEMGEAMRHLLENRSVAEAQARRGLETVLALHTCAHRAEQLSKICEEVLQ